MTRLSPLGFASLLVAWTARTSSLDSVIPLDIFPHNLSEPSIVQRRELIEYVEGKGYHLEEHKVVTEDGYVLFYHRLRSSLSPHVHVWERPVLLVHDLAMSSAAFLTPASWALAYKLKDAEIDVWLANSRGNRFSREHITLDPAKDEEYWDFSLHELGVFDLTAGINYILSYTNSSQLSIVGYSSGATEAIILAAYRPTMQEKIDKIVALAPLLFRRAKNTTIESVDRPAVIEDWRRNKTAYGVFLDGIHWKHICTKNVGNLCGLLAEEMKKERGDWSNVLRFFPAGTSEKSYLQTWTTGLFIKGVDHNNDTLKPEPEYDFSQVSVPLHIFYSKSDKYIPPEGVQILSDKVQNAILQPVQAENFGHFDFLWGYPENEKLYMEIIRILYFPVNLSS